MDRMNVLKAANEDRDFSNLTHDELIGTCWFNDGDKPDGESYNSQEHHLYFVPTNNSYILANYEEGVVENHLVFENLEKLKLELQNNDWELLY